MKTFYLKYLAALVLLTLISSKPNDWRRYSRIVKIKTESNDFVVKHYHNWKLTTNNQDCKKSAKMINSPFESASGCAYMVCFNKENLKDSIIFPSSALNHILISKNQKYIVGLSNIKIGNPYQLLVWNIKGELIYKRHISSIEAKLTQTDFEYFKKNHPSSYNAILENNLLVKKGGNYHIDFTALTSKDDSWKYLYSHQSPNYLSNNFSESVTNFIEWYNQDNPNLKLNYSFNKLSSISLLDPDEKRITIELK
tara:strand:- start:15 stop:773 length:759 start_codon:yes stop_codon:yes gene_type:complete